MCIIHHNQVYRRVGHFVWSVDLNTIGSHVFMRDDISMCSFIIIKFVSPKFWCRPVLTFLEEIQGHAPLNILKNCHAILWHIELLEVRIIIIGFKISNKPDKSSLHQQFCGRTILDYANLLLAMELSAFKKATTISYPGLIPVSELGVWVRWMVRTRRRGSQPLWFPPDYEPAMPHKTKCKFHVNIPARPRHRHS